MAKAVGIDLGTTSAVMAMCQEGEVTVVPNREGARSTPFYVAFVKGKGILVGEEARRQADAAPDRLTRGLKRFLGTSHVIPIAGKEYTPIEIAACLFRQLKDDAARYAGEEVTQAVITVPAHFSDVQRIAVRDAAQDAGFQVMGLLNEPSAAALAYDLDDHNGSTVLVFHLGGATCYVTLLKVVNGAFEVLVCDEDSRLGASSFDEAVVHWFKEAFRQQEGVDLTRNPQAMVRLRQAAEAARHTLSVEMEAPIYLSDLAVVEGTSRHLECTLSRSQFVELTPDLVERCRQLVVRTMQQAKIDRNRLDEVVLSGGGTHIPVIRSMLLNFLGKVPCEGFTPEEVVAIGAAKFAHNLLQMPSSPDVEPKAGSSWGERLSSMWPKSK